MQLKGGEKMGKPEKWVAISVIITAIVVGSIVWVVKPAPTPPEIAELQARVSELETTVSEQSARIAELEAMPKLETLKAGWIYVGPIGDFGWTYAHNEGRLYAEEKLPWLETVYVESVLEADCPRVIDRLITEEKCDVVFTTSFGFGRPATLDAGEKYPDKIFFHCSGYERSANVGTYFVDQYQCFYLNGLAAGALNTTGKIGYVGAFQIPELIRHLNAYALGAQEINPAITLDTRWTGSWVLEPAAAREAAEGLIAEGCSAIACTIDTPDIPAVCEEHTDSMDMGYPIYAFSHYSPMTQFAPDAILTGQLVRWGPMYGDILINVHEGFYTPHNLADVDYWDLMASGNAVLGTDFETPINPKWVPDLEAKMVTDKITGETMSAYDLIMLRARQMSEKAVLFDPYTGPIYDSEGALRIKPGERASHDDLWSMMWAVKGVTIPP